MHEQMHGTTSNHRTVCVSNGMVYWGKGTLLGVSKQTQNSAIVKMRIKLSLLSSTCLLSSFLAYFLDWVTKWLNDHMDELSSSISCWGCIMHCDLILSLLTPQFVFCRRWSFVVLHHPAVKRRRQFLQERGLLLYVLLRSLSFAIILVCCFCCSCCVVPCIVMMLNIVPFLSWMFPCVLETMVYCRTEFYPVMLLVL